jgi:glycosyltransferase involved in cell wall biosynthesis
MAKVVVIGAAPASMVNFRRELLETLVAGGHEVICMANPAQAELEARIRALGVDFVPYEVDRRSRNPFQDVKTYLQLRRTLRRLKPDVVFAYTIKPIVWSGLASRGIKGTRFFGMVEGTGYAFQGQGWKRGLLRQVASMLYRVALLRAKAVFFLNRDDPQTFYRQHIVGPEKAVILNGIGVDLDYYGLTPLPEGKGPVFLLIGRLLKEKGVREFAAAARKVRMEHPDARFQILGYADPTSEGVPIEEVEAWQEEGIVEYLGSTPNVRPFIEASHVFVLPSYYGEGLPRTIMEAMSMGRAILTTDNVGCRETVEEGQNGFLVPRQDVEALAEKAAWFAENPDKWQAMADASRALAEERFDVHKINAVILSTMGLDG